MVVTDETLPPGWTVKASGHWLTKGGEEWGAADWRLPSGQVLDLNGGTLELDFERISDAELSDIPRHIIPTEFCWATGKTGEEAWRSVPVGQSVKNGTIIGNYSKLADRCLALGRSLRISATVLQGHSVAAEKLTLKDFGAFRSGDLPPEERRESFPLQITGAMNGLDRHALSTVDPSHEFDEDDSLERSHITDCTIDDSASRFSNDQVSCFMIDGAMTNDRITDPWAEVGAWRQMYRRNPYISNCEGWVRDDPLALRNQFQLATIYQAKGGEITRCKSHGYQAGAYGDYYTTFDLDVHHNDFEALRPVAQFLSPTPLPIAEQFAAYGLKIRSNALRMLPTESDWHAAVMLSRLGGVPARAIRDVTIDDNDFIMVGKPGAGNVAIRAKGVDGLTVLPTNRFSGFKTQYAIASDCTRVTLPPAPTSRRGCGRFFQLID